MLLNNMNIIANQLNEGKFIYIMAKRLKPFMIEYIRDVSWFNGLIIN